MKNIFRRKPKQLNQAHFTERWKALQVNCADRQSWPQAISDADRLLDDALKKARYKGKTTGERLVAAQRSLTSNDTVWLGHKLHNRIKGEEVDVQKLKKKDIVIALSGFRQALRDLGALEKSND